MLVNSNIYNHLGTSLTPKKRNTTHKSSELKAVYNNMAKYNQKSPMYLLSLSQSKQEHIINIKEAAITLRDVSKCFADTDSEIYSKKVLHSENQDIISGSFKKGDLSDLPEQMSIKIDSLATEQVNVGNYLPSMGRSIKNGSYGFTISTINSNSHFNITVNSEDNNLSIQQKLSQYINNRNIGIQASVITEGADSALMINSTETGKPNTDDGLHFSFTSNSEPNIVDVLGLDNTTTYPSNSSFSINGEQHTSTSNQISINQIIELDFHKTSDAPVNINFVPDTNEALSQVDMFVDAYNSLVELSDTKEKINPGSRNLFKDISIIVDKHKYELEAAGLSIGEDNKIVKDEALLVQSVQSGEFAELFQDISSFKDDISHATERLTIDPIAYINKLVVTYPNTNHKFGAVYNKSLYSGLIYNNYA